MLTVIFLFLLGLAFGSFVNALVWRIYKQSKAKKGDNKYSITKGRSMCPHCQHELAAADLIPLISWILLRGKCRYCKKPISAGYPIVELAGGLIFSLLYVFWPQPLQNPENWLLFITWLAASVGLLALFVYDLKWMILPNRIIYPVFYIAITGRLAYILLFEADKLGALLALLASVAVASGLFWAIFHLSSGRWIGYGDVRLGWITGTLLADPLLSILMIFGASLLGTLVMLPLMIAGKSALTSKIPFGPFLIAATWLAWLFGNQIAIHYKELLLPPL